MNTRDFKIRELLTKDIRGLNRLSPVDWNFDYEVFLQEYIDKDFFHAFAITKDGCIVGTGNIFLNGKIGWLANIIIEENVRNNGLGFRITKFMIEFLSDKNCETQILLATPLGEPLYRKLGFMKITEYRSFETKNDYIHLVPGAIHKLTYSDLENLIKLDEEANGEKRAHLIKRYYDTGLGYFSEDNEMLGFYLPDFGRGLVLAKDTKAGIELLTLKHSKMGQRTYLPVDNTDGIDFFENNRFKQGSSSTRMILGKGISWHPSFIFSYGGGYCG